MSVDRYVAVDLGATSGRVIVGTVDAGTVTTTVAARFPNLPLAWPDGSHWNLPTLYQQVVDGLRCATARYGEPRSVGVASWGVDYGLIGEHGRLLGLPYHYRDERTRGLSDSLDEALLYRRTGVPNLAINTSTQLVAERSSGALENATALLFVADLFTFLLTGERTTERTLASTSQLFDPAQSWADDVIAGLGLPRAIFLEPRTAGETIGVLRPEVVAEVGAEPQVRAVASHDTASAVAAVPAGGPDFAYISCGTWALIGVEVDKAIRTQESLAAGFSNELGAGGAVCHQKNLTALWILTECLREWSSDGRPREVTDLVTAAADVPAFRSLIDPDAAEFGRPNAMPEKIARFCAATGQPVPSGEAETVRCIIDSLALAFAHHVHQARRLSGARVEVIHVVGGGASNALLCRLTADAAGLPVVAGPVEATATGNVLVQAFGGSTAEELAAVRAVSAASAQTIRYEPRSGPATRIARERFAALPRPGSR